MTITAEHDSSLIEKVQRRLNEARSVLYTIGPMALVIVAAAIVTLFDHQSNLKQISVQYASLVNVVQLGAQIEREINAHFSPKKRDNAASIDKLNEKLHSFVAMQRSAERARAKMDKAQSVPLEDVAQFNETLAKLALAKPGEQWFLRNDAISTIVSREELAEYRLRDLAATGFLVSIDTTGVYDALSRYLNKTDGKNEHADFTELVSDLDIILGEYEHPERARTLSIATRLREAAANHDLEYGADVPGGSQTSLDQAREWMFELHGRVIDLSKNLEGNSGFNVPLVQQEITMLSAVSLYPAGLLIGYGVLAMLLLFADRKISEVKFGENRKKAADVGVVFTQLRGELHREPLMAWLTLFFLLGCPLIGSYYLLVRLAEAMSVGTAWISWLLTFLASAICVLVTIMGCRISKQSVSSR